MLTISQLNDAADLYHLQLVDRRTYAIATQALYEQLELEVASSMSNSDACIFTTRTPGHALIRELQISFDVGNDEDPKKAYQYLEMLLENLPQDALSRCSYVYYRRMTFNKTCCANVQKLFVAPTLASAAHQEALEVSKKA